MKFCFLGQCCDYSGCLNINGAIKQAGGLVLEARESRQQGAFFFFPAPEDHLPGRAFSVITNFFSHTMLLFSESIELLISGIL